MKKKKLLAAAILVGCAVLLAPPKATAATATPAPPHDPSTGLKAAQTISMITGVAISPLLGVGTVGAYQWWTTPAEKRQRLPWFAHPGFWIPALLLVGIVAVKDIAGTAAPTAFKKPFDVAEAIENKISGLIAAGAFVPLIISIFPETGGPQSEASLAGAGFAALSLGTVGNWLLTPFAMVAFALVWLTSHAINILILISPFTVVDTALKSARLFLLSLVTGISFANPYVGAVFSVLLIVAAWFLAGWSFRLTVFGTLYLWDLCTFRRTRFQPGAESNWLFTAGEVQGAPVRTYGRLRREGPARLVFEYRPWLFLPRKVFALPEGRYFVGRGLLYSEVRRREEGGAAPLFILPPRYATHEEATARVYGFEGVEPIGVLKGLGAMWAWLKGSPEPAPAPAAAG